MRVDFYNVDEKKIGSVTLVDGEPVYTGSARNIVEGLPIVTQPGRSMRELTPADGEVWLRALPHEFRGPYLSAVFRK